MFARRPADVRTGRPLSLRQAIIGGGSTKTRPARQMRRGSMLHACHRSLAAGLLPVSGSRLRAAADNRNHPPRDSSRPSST